MKNLKKVLAFALVVCMMLSTIVSATAISATDYTDYSTIKNADQVAVLTELGVINGYPDESFKPEKTVSRAEMAKMITVILNKGTEAAGNYDGAQVFSDVYADMWCKGYINYCNTLGIVVGMGDGTYKPNQGVTVVQTAKMLLVAMGYDPVVEGFEGANWEVNVSAIAAQAGLYNGVTANAAAECSRDTAALIIYNALVASTVDGYTNGKAVVGSQTMLGKYFNAVVVTGAVVANDYANLFGDSALYNAKHASTEVAIFGTQYVDDDDPIDPGMKLFTNEYVYDASWPITFAKSYVDEYGNNDMYVSQIFEVATTLEQVGQTVKVIAQLKDNYDLYYKNGIRYADYTFNGKVYGVAMDVESVAKEYDGEYSLLSKSDLKKEGVVLDNNTRYFVNYAAAWEQYGYPSRYNIEDLYSEYGFYIPALTGKDNDNIVYNPDGGYTKIMDNDGDGVAEIVILWRPFFAIAEYSTYFKTYSFDSLDKNKDPDSTYSSVDPDDIVCEDDIDDGDRVLVCYVDGTYYVEVCDSKTVTVDTVSVDANKKDYIKADGTTYYESGLYWAYQTYFESKGSGADPSDNDLYWNLSECDTDEEYILYFDSYGNVVAYEEPKGPPSSGKYAMVSASYISDNTPKDDDYYLYLTKGGATKTSYVEVQWEGSRVQTIDADALPFFVSTSPTRTTVELPFNRQAYPFSWNDILSTSYLKGTNAFYVDYPGSWVEDYYSDYFGTELGVYDYYSFGNFTALIRTSYNDDGEVNVKKLEDVHNFSYTDADGYMQNVSVTAGQWKYTDATGRTYYATDDTAFFIYQYDPITGEVVDRYSFFGYDNLPAISYSWSCNCGYSDCACDDDEHGVPCDYCLTYCSDCYQVWKCSCDATYTDWTCACETDDCTCTTENLAAGVICDACETDDCTCDDGADHTSVVNNCTCTAENLAAGKVCTTCVNATCDCNAGADHVVIGYYHDEWYATGISAMYGEVENGGKDSGTLNALVIETNADVKKIIKDYVFIYNYTEKEGTASAHTLRYLVDAINADGEYEQFWVDAVSSHSNILTSSGSLRYGMYARYECDDQYLDGKTIYDVTYDSTGNTYNSTVVSYAKKSYNSAYLVLTGLDDRLYMTSDSLFYYRCAVKYNSTGVNDFVLAETDKDGMFPDGGGKTDYCSSYLVIWKDSVINGKAAKEVVAIVGGYDDPMVYNTTLKMYVELGSAANIANGTATYMTSDNNGIKSRGTYEYFCDAVAPKTGPGPAGVIEPVAE